MDIINLVFYKQGREELKLIYREKNISEIIKFCQDNKFDGFCVCDEHGKKYYNVSKPTKEESVSRYDIDFYSVAGDNLDSIHTLTFRVSNPLHYEQFCYDNFFYKFQIKSKEKTSRFFYCGKIVSKDYDGVIKRLAINYPECTRFLLFGNLLRIGATKKDVVLEEIKRKLKKI